LETFDLPHLHTVLTLEQGARRPHDPKKLNSSFHVDCFVLIIWFSCWLFRFDYFILIIWFSCRLFSAAEELGRMERAQYCSYCGGRCNGDARVGRLGLRWWGGTWFGRTLVSVGSQWLVQQLRPYLVSFLSLYSWVLSRSKGFSLQK